MTNYISFVYFMALFRGGIYCVSYGSNGAIEVLKYQKYIVYLSVVKGGEEEEGEEEEEEEEEEGLSS
ncbi:hypothetical protein DASC09_042360 [Saccharomycopsis crataegensis]|uniref:Uncharacterized protein n=1 Tax=Saccharomycopsis crataegensis TaxID=43959 RepID=A0AAV5QQB0_9ASCO|nr:hypothetical protein DASC09_042360 [Saccharomycopsis crataegensis]